MFDDPKNYGLYYEDVTLKAGDGIALFGCLIKGHANKVMIQSHFGVQFCRSGHTPKGKGGAVPNRFAAYDWLGTNAEPVLSWLNRYMA